MSDPSPPPPAPDPSTWAGPGAPPPVYPPPAPPSTAYPPTAYPPPAYPPPAYPPPAYPPPVLPVAASATALESGGTRRWAPREPWIETGDLRAAALVALALTVVGAAAGLLWGRISPHSRGFVVSAGTVIPDETKDFIAADGRFLIITGLLGLLAGTAAWFWRARRGPVLATGLAVGSLVGAALTALVGHAVSDGVTSGALNTAIRLPVTLHARGLVAVEAVLALALYLLGVLLSGPDDLGRPGSSSPPPGVPAGSVDPGLDVQGVGRYGYGPGFGEQGQFPPQQPYLGP